MSADEAVLFPARAKNLKICKSWHKWGVSTRYNLIIAKYEELARGAWDRRSGRSDARDRQPETWDKHSEIWGVKIDIRDK